MRQAAWLGLAAVVLGLSACATSETPAAPVSTAVEVPVTPPELPTMPSFSIGQVDLRAVNAPAELSDTTRGRIQGVLDRYLTNAVLIPLRTAERIGDLSSVFMGQALERMEGADRAALVDEGMPKAEEIEVTTASADLTALLGPDGIAVMAADIHLVVTADVAGTPLTIERAGELLLSPERDAWKISGYQVRVTRDTPVGVTTTTVSE